MSIISRDIDQAVALLQKEDVVAIPTETVYGLAGNIYSSKAINKIFTLKQRPLFNPLIVHTYSVDQLNQFVSHFPIKAKLLAEAFWPGSLTLVLPKKEIVPDLVTGGKKTVGVRIPDHPICLKLLQQLDFPLAAPSANPFTRISPTEARHVAQYFGEELKLVLDGGPCQNGLESTIIGFDGEEAVLYRLGSISVEEIEQIVGSIKILNKKDVNPEAPGMLLKHYSPRTPIYMTEDVDSFISKNLNKNIGLITFKKEYKGQQIKAQETLSPSGDLKKAAANLYNALHKLDGLYLDMIVTEKFPDVGLGKSINDRLSRATK